MAAVLTLEHDLDIGETQHLIWGTIAMDSSYPTGGEAVAHASIHKIVKLFVQSEGGYSFKFDPSGQLLLAYQVAGHSHDLLIKGGQAAASTAALAWYATDILGKEAATDKTIAGSASATKGGVIAVAAGALIEVAAATDLSSLTALDFIGIAST